MFSTVACSLESVKGKNFQVIHSQPFLLWGCLTTFLKKQISLRFIESLKETAWLRPAVFDDWHVRYATCGQNNRFCASKGEKVWIKQAKPINYDLPKVALIAFAIASRPLLIRKSFILKDGRLDEGNKKIAKTKVLAKVASVTMVNLRLQAQILIRRHLIRICTFNKNVA